MNWNPTTWKRPARLLLGVVTIWPVIYMVLFMGTIFSIVLVAGFSTRASGPRCNEIEVFQLDDMIKAGDLGELRITRSNIEAFDRRGKCYRAYVSNETTRERIIARAREMNANGTPRVAKISEDTSEPEMPALAGWDGHTIHRALHYHHPDVGLDAFIYRAGREG